MSQFVWGVFLNEMNINCRQTMPFDDNYIKSQPEYKKNLIKFLMACVCLNCNRKKTSK